LSARWTSTWTNAPVSFSSSHGAVVSHARRRTSRSFHRADWPGWSATVFTMPLRLLSTPKTATRSGIGVIACAAALEAALRDSAEGAPCSCLPLHEASASSTSSDVAASLTLIRESRAHSPR
jgi:hypothetical protein